ncbi:MAG: biotin-dependent carboxyltransferase family protein [Candidatus Udaeobacter sp.]
MNRCSVEVVKHEVIITRAGFLSSVQDLGRTGFREFGVSLSGALDPFGMRVANLFVGNDEGAAGLEITFGGVQLQFQDERIVAWCGGEFNVQIGSQPLPAGHVALLQAGGELKFGGAQIGCRCWLAISGGLDVPMILGSRSTDLRANFGGFGGRALRDGDVIPLGPRPGSSDFAKATADNPIPATRISSWTASHDWVSPAKREPILRFVRGMDWTPFNASTLQRVTSEPFTVSPDSDRMGVRLTGPELPRGDNVAEPAKAGQPLQQKSSNSRSDADRRGWATQPVEATGCPPGAKRVDLISEAVVPGTLQVPPSGQPILLLGDCQTIGGYPKIAHVITVDLGVAAQVRAGDRLRFSEVSLGDAHQMLLQRERSLERFRIGLSLREP